jgi:4-hydroxybenzoate polyprenyltransferase/chlorophyll synthase
VVQVIFQLRFAAGLAMALAAGARWSGLAVIGAFAWVCATWVVYLLNGISDIDGDRRNGSRRPLASGRLSPAAAAHVCAVVAAIGVVAAALVSMPMVLLVTGMVMLGWLYSMGTRPMKASPVGFTIVVVLGGLLTYLASWLAVGTGMPPLSLLVFGAAMSLWMALAGTTKDLADFHGDRAANRRTLPIILGDRRSRWAMSALVGLVAAAFVVVAWLVEPTLRLPAALLGIGAVALVLCLHNRCSRGDRDRLRVPYHLFMAIQYGVHLTVLASSLH